MLEEYNNIDIEFWLVYETNNNVHYLLVYHSKLDQIMAKPTKTAVE